MDDIAVKVEHVSKAFKLPHEKQASVKSLVVNLTRRRRGYEVQHVLEDISFEIKKGEFFGIVGRNGSGKSTMLKLLAGIYTPDKGSIKVYGKLTPFIELGVGFNPELTGRENVFLNGALLGFNRKEVESMYAGIVEFAELERFMDQKLKNYSSGMQVRLAFSIAIRAQSDVLIMDEVLAVGDAAFQKKCFEVFRNLKEKHQTIILVTHDMSNIEKFCDKVLIIDKGVDPKVVDVAEAITIYNKLNYSANNEQRTQASQHSAIRISKLECLDHDGKSQKFINNGEEMTVRIHLDRAATPAEANIVIGLAFYDAENVNISGPNSFKKGFTAGAKYVDYTIAPVPFAVGEYRIAAGVFDEYVKETYDFIDNAGTIFVNSDEIIHGKVTLVAQWKEQKKT